jgi:hypothetical protein
MGGWTRCSASCRCLDASPQLDFASDMSSARLGGGRRGLLLPPRDPWCSGGHDNAKSGNLVLRATDHGEIWRVR